MASCKDCKNCIHYSLCNYEEICHYDIDNIKNAKDCSFFKDRSRFVELKHAEWDEHEDMYGDPVYCCSNCREKYFLEEWTPIENRYFYCPNCGAKMDEQALKERESE